MNNKDYWAERFALLEDASHKEGVRVYNRISKQYELAIKNIEKDIAAWYTRYATETGVSLSEAKKILNAGELKAFKMDVKEYIEKGRSLDPKWFDDLEKASVKVHVSRLEALKVQLQNQMENVTAQTNDAINQMAVDIFSEQYYKAMYETQTGIGVGWDVMKLDMRVIDKAIRKPWAFDGKNFSARIWDNRKKLVGEVHTELTQALIRGSDPQKTINVLAKRMNVSKSQAGRLIMTESAFFHSAATQEAFKDLDVKKYEILATLDRRTSQTCRDLDGKVFNRGEYVVGVTAPPFHPWCRTTTVPYFDDDFIDQRAARDDEGKYYTVPSTMKYHDWRKTFVDGGSKEGLVEISKDGLKSFVYERIKTAAEELRDCKTTKSVENLMKSKEWFYKKTTTFSNGVTSVNDTNKYISLSKIDLETAKEIYLTYDKVFKKFPQFIGKFHQMMVVPAKKMESLRAVGQCGFFQQVSFNLDYFGNRKRLLEMVNRDVESGWAVKVAKPTRIVSHEIGHCFDATLTNVKFNRLRANGVKIARGDVEPVSELLRTEVLKKLNLTLDDIPRELSRYATKDSKEWFAECFAEYTESENPRRMAKEFGKQLEKLIEEYEEDLKGL